MIAEKKPDIPNDPRICQTCGEGMVYIWGEDYWACMNLAHGKLIRYCTMPKKESVVTRSGVIVGDGIRRGLKKMGPWEPPAEPVAPEPDPEDVKRLITAARQPGG